MEREYILAEIRRTAEANGGTPLGVRRFKAETGIRESEWGGRYWARWSDALVDAGFSPNQLQQRFSDDEVLAVLVVEIRRLGRMPTRRELILRHRQDATVPSQGVFERLGSKALMMNRIAEYCKGQGGHEDVLEILGPPVVTPVEPAHEESPAGSAPFGFVYLVRSGRYYKIGHTFDVGRRRYDLAIQLPDPVTEEHVIRTDDPIGIERYWHSRFADSRKNGEWFELTRADVAVFKRRKFM